MVVPPVWPAAAAVSRIGPRVAYAQRARAASTSTPHDATAVRQPSADASGTVSERVSIEPTFNAAV